MVCRRTGCRRCARDAYALATTTAALRSEVVVPSRSRRSRVLAGPTKRSRDMRRATELNPALRAGVLAARTVASRSRISSRERSAPSTARPRSSLPIGPAGLASRASTFSATRTRARRGCSNSSRRPARPTATSCSCSARPIRRLGRADEAASALAVGAKGEPQWSDPWTDEMAGFRRGYAALLKDATAYVDRRAVPIRRSRILEQLRRTKPDDIVLMAHLGQVYVAAGRDDDGVALLEQVVAKRTRSLRGVRRSGDGLHASESAVEGARRRRSGGVAQPVVRARHTRRWGWCCGAAAIRAEP